MIAPPLNSKSSTAKMFMYGLLVLFLTNVGLSPLMAQVACNCSLSDNCTYSPTGSDFLCIGDGSTITLTEALADYASLPNCNGLPFASNTTMHILIKGTLLFEDDDDFTFDDNSEIIMAPGASIEIEDGAKLRIEPGSRIHGCTQMWHRIYVRKGGRLIMNEALIQHGHHAIQTEDESYVTLGDCTFKDNYIGVYSGPADITGPKNFYMAITGCNFEYQEGLLPSYTGQPEMKSSISYAGIWLEDYKFVTIGSEDGSSKNEFFYLHFGIVLKRANGVITNCQFASIDYFEEPAASTAAIYLGGVQGKNYEVRVKGLGKNHSSDQPTFSRCRLAIQTGAIHADIRNCYGLLLSGVAELYAMYGYNFTLENNWFESHNGIFSYNNLNGGLFNYWLIQNNKFILSDTPASLFGDQVQPGGIRFFDLHLLKSKGGLGVHWNDFEVLSDKIPILRGYATSGMNFTNNTIDIYTTVSPYHAISWQGGILPNTFAYNSLTDHTTTSNHYGFLIGLAKGNNYYCNSTDGFSTAFNFRANNNYSNFATNSIYDHIVGLDLANIGPSNAFLGPQSNTMNQWLGGTSYLTAAARHHSSNPIVTGNSRFDVYTSSSPLWPSPLVDPSSSWFLQSGVAGSYCQVETPNDWPGKYLLSDGDVRVLQDSLDGFSAEDRWTLRYFLYQKLSEYPDLLDSSTLASTWYSDGEQTNLEALQAIEELFRNELTGLDSAALAGYETRAAELSDIVSTLATIDSTYGLNYPTGVQEVRDSLLEIILDLQEADSVANVAMAANRAVVLDTLTAWVAAYTPSDTMEAYFKQVYDVWLSWIGTGSPEPDSSDQVTLAWIASRCLGIGGPAVAIARGLENQYLEQAYDDDTLCSQQAQQQSSEAGVPILDGFVTVWPNPASDRILIQGIGGPGVWTLTDPYGRELIRRSIDLASGPCEVNGLAQLNAGHYFWHFSPTNGTPTSHGILVKK